MKEKYSFEFSPQVYATVEEMSLSEKVIIFKKKRRKGYKRNRGNFENNFQEKKI